VKGIMSLSITVGNMGSGKTEALMDSHEEALAQGLRSIILTPSQDSNLTGRVYGKKSKRSIESVCFSSVSDVKSYVYGVHFLKHSSFPQVLHIDEVHIACGQHDREKALKLLDVCADLEYGLGLEIKLYGLDKDLRGYTLEPYRTIQESPLLRESWAIFRAREGWCDLCEDYEPSEYSWMIEDLPAPIPGMLGVDYLGLCKSHFFALSEQRLDLHRAGIYGQRLPK